MEVLVNGTMNEEKENGKIANKDFCKKLGRKE